MLTLVSHRISNTVANQALQYWSCENARRAKISQRRPVTFRILQESNLIKIYYRLCVWFSSVRPTSILSSINQNGSFTNYFNAYEKNSIGKRTKRIPINFIVNHAQTFPICPGVKITKNAITGWGKNSILVGPNSSYESVNWQKLSQLTSIAKHN